ncbi:MAG: LuxR C-terminal-related transcriptional regulator [Chloroflexota bacterium]
MKLFMPRLRPSLVIRPQLIAKLNRGLHRKLTLISAPAGFGKTTLVSEWISAGERPAAWLSLDENDAEPVRFLTYFLAALQCVVPEIGKAVWKGLQSPQPPPVASMLTNLLNEIATIPQNILLVLDDYHRVDAPAVDEALTFLLEHLPPQLHLVITTREDPLLPLSRLRVRNMLTELRAADLRFTEEETAVFLNKVTGLEFSVSEIAALEKRTEGWIAGLQLAALSMQGRSDVHGFIEAFAGNDRYIVDYLVDEVLDRQPEHIRRFLLQTAVLSRLSGPLCAAVCYGDDVIPPGEECDYVLAMLERSNLFLIPLDDKRHWYRYHHLFGDVLQAHLMKEQPEIIATLHQRASAWYERNGFTADAVNHAFIAKDLARAARIIELAWAEMDGKRQSTMWLDWAQTLPDELLRTRPVLSVGCAWAYLDTGNLEAAMTRLRDAEQCLENPANMVVADEAEFQVLPGAIAAARTYHALALGDMAGTIKYAQQALKQFPEEAHLRRGTPAALLGLASWASGDLAAAVHSFAKAMDSYRKAGNILYVITGAYVLADMKMVQGQLREAAKIYKESVQLAEAHGEPVLRGAADLYTGLCELALERNDLEAAHKYLQLSKELGEAAPLPRWRYRWYLAQSRIKAAAGNLEAALEALDEAERHYVRGPVPDVRTTAAMKARLWVAQGRLAEAQRWLNEQGLSTDANLNYLREFDHMTVARLYVAQYRHNRDSLQGVIPFLERLLATAVAGGRNGSVIEILVQQAMAYAARDSIAEALVPLAQALTLAEPEGYVRIFVDNGPPMAKLLQRMPAESGRVKEYIRVLLAALGVPQNMHQSAVSAQPLLEPLSERELEVLQLVAAGLSNREIAERLFLALSTIKGHNRVIYDKLQVSRRTEAVVRARELGLL